MRSYSCGETTAFKAVELSLQKVEDKVPANFQAHRHGHQDAGDRQQSPDLQVVCAGV